MATGGKGSPEREAGMRCPDSDVPSAHLPPPCRFQMTPPWPPPRICLGIVQTCLGMAQPRTAVPPTGVCGGQ